MVTDSPPAVPEDVHVQEVYDAEGSTAWSRLDSQRRAHSARPAGRLSGGDLGVYTDNAAAIAMYRRLGYARAHRLVSSAVPARSAYP